MFRSKRSPCRPVRTLYQLVKAFHLANRAERALCCSGRAHYRSKGPCIGPRESSARLRGLRLAKEGTCLTKRAVCWPDKGHFMPDQLLFYPERIIFQSERGIFLPNGTLRRDEKALRCHEKTLYCLERTLCEHERPLLAQGGGGSVPLGRSCVGPIPLASYLDP